MKDASCQGRTRRRVGQRVARRVREGQAHYYVGHGRSIRQEYERIAWKTSRGGLFIKNREHSKINKWLKATTTFS